MKTKWLLTLLSISVLLVSAVISVSSVMAQGQSGTTLSATVTASAKWDRIYGWEIDKSVTPAHWDLFVGDSGTSQYTIKVTKKSPVDVLSVSAEVCVTNGGAVATENLKIVVELEEKGQGPNWILLEKQTLEPSTQLSMQNRNVPCFAK
jgi:hypothetical protein